MTFTLLYAGQAIGHVDLGPPGERGVRVGVLAPAPEYEAVRPAIRRVYDGIGTLGGGTAESIREGLLALTAEMRANLALADAAGVVVETHDIMIMDPVTPGLDPMGVLTATTIHVATVFASDANS